MDRDTSLRFKNEEEAKKRARDDLKAIIKSRLNYKSLQFIREELEQKKDEVDRELQFNIQRKVTDLSHSVNTLTEKEMMTKSIKDKIKEIRDIWKGSCGKFASIS